MVEAARFVVEDILSGQIKTQDLPLDRWTYEDALNRPGSLSAVIPLSSDYCTEEILDPWRTAIYVARGSTIEWGGILAPPSLSVGSRELSVSCFGWLGYWDRRVIRSLAAQPEAGGVLVCRPNSDSTSAHVFGLPDRTDLWRDVIGGYSPRQGIVADPDVGVVPSYLASFDVPTISDLHPIASVTLDLTATLQTYAIQTVTPQVKIGGVTYSGDAVTLGWVFTPTNCSYTWTTNPATGVAWTVADIEDFASGSYAGFTGSANSYGYDTVVNSMSLTVKYDAGFTDYFTQTDQFEIFRTLVVDAQSTARFGVGWDLGIDVTWDALSGVLRDRVEAYRPSQAKNLGEGLRQLAAVVNGFDFAMSYDLNTTTDRVDKSIRLYYPTKGRTTGFLFEFDPGSDPDNPRRSNVLGRGFADPIEFAWAGDGWGSGNDDTRLKSPYVDETLRGVYPPYDAAPQWNSVVEQSTLDEHTEAAFSRTNRPRRVPVLRVDPDLYPAWGDYTIGDTVQVRTIDGYGSTGPSPESWRVTGRSVTGDVEYNLLLGDPVNTEEDA